VDVWDLDTVRSLPPESRPSSSSVVFVGGVLHGQVEHRPTTVDDDRLPFIRYEHGQPVCHWYHLTGWRPDPGVWIYTFSDVT